MGTKCKIRIRVERKMGYYQTVLTAASKYLKTLAMTSAGSFIPLLHSGRVRSKMIFLKLDLVLEAR